MLLGDFGGLFGVSRGSKNRPEKNKTFSGFWGPLLGAGNSEPPQKAGEIKKFRVLPSRVLLLYLQQTTNLNHSLVAPVNRGRRI